MVKVCIFFLNNLLIKTETNKIRIPISDIDVLLVNNYKCTITSQLINKLTENNILIIFCNNSYEPASICLPISGNYNSLKIFQEQLNWRSNYKGYWWKQIIKAKINNQANFLRNVLNKEEAFWELVNLMNNVTEFDVTNREGHAAKIYWHNVYGINFKRHEEDYVNSLLNYGYTVLRGYFTRSIIKKGLDPRISLFHKSFDNFFALASDLMEPFRIIVDIIVYKLFLKNTENFYLDKQEIIEFFNSKIKLNGLEHYINNAIDKFIDALINQTEFPELNFDQLYECV
ncbi:type II CRISPR-associated endonuclease Cas1 [Ureaplasma ceti]|uniref:CRISPR-associated endonuclease Cas1 n=1 Tax=Ureaplasma ceti TaxID=3119530 RepID=A0ABP9U4U6_9BACT